MTENNPMTQPSKRRFSSHLKLVFIGSLVALAVLVTQQFNLPELLQTSLMWVRSLGFIGAIAFIAIYNLATLLFVPGSLLTMKGGSLASDLAAINMSNRPTTTETQILQWVIRIIGLIATIAVTVYMTRLAKKALDQSILEGETARATPNNR
jgi:uncharacterized membrane protein YdjX (TVP38/TMEM64 family)